MNRRHIALPLLLLALSACEEPKKEEIAPAPTLANKEESLLRIAKATEAAGDAAAALELYRQVSVQTPDSAEAWAGQARLHELAGESDAAIAAYEKALALSADDADLPRLLANALIRAGEAERALERLAAAEARDPEDARILNARGVALDMLDRHGEAQASFRAALEKETGGKAYIENNLAMSHLLAGEYDQAIALLGKLLSAHGDDARLRQNLALAYGLKGDGDKALKLGLKDLPRDAAEENAEFYRVYASRLNSIAPSSSSAAAAAAAAAAADTITAAPDAAENLNKPEDAPDAFSVEAQ